MSKQRVSSKNLWRENLAQALSIIRAHRMRSSLLILGVAIGIMTILAMVTVMSGLVGKINDDLESASRPYLFVTRFDFFVSGQDDDELLRRKKLEPADANALAGECDVLDKVCYFITYSDPVVIYNKGEHTAPLELDGSGFTFPEIFSLPIEHGRSYTGLEELHRERVVVLGYGPAQDLFPNENPIGKYVDIMGHRYRVVGTFANREHFIGSISNNFALIPYTSYHKDFQRDQDDTSIAANVKEGFTLDEAEGQITNVMRRRRHVRPGEENNFHVTTSTAFLEIVGGVTLAISAILVVIASIGLVVGGIGVMNIMLISVAERTREIGIRMALGANKKDIIQQFLMESATLTGLGGVVGTVLGIGAALLISSQIHFPFRFSPGWTIAAVAFSALIGIIFGIYPARRAARLNPVDALRYE
ncbi:MAG: ABC transporter permease [Candidatus Krumholzibacteriia bacterium]